jgi:hypothetical protein
MEMCLNQKGTSCRVFKTMKECSECSYYISVDGVMVCYDNEDDKKNGEL